MRKNSSQSSTVLEDNFTFTDLHKLEFSVVVFRHSAAASTCQIERIAVGILELTSQMHLNIWDYCNGINPNMGVYAYVCVHLCSAAVNNLWKGLR